MELTTAVVILCLALMFAVTGFACVMAVLSARASERASNARADELGALVRLFADRAASITDNYLAVKQIELEAMKDNPSPAPKRVAVPPQPPATTEDFITTFTENTG